LLAHLGNFAFLGRCAWANKMPETDPRMSQRGGRSPVQVSRSLSFRTRLPVVVRRALN
jgi:hypothetical protein